MKIIEIKDSFIKLESEERFPLTSFLKIEDEFKTYIAQVVKVANFSTYYGIYAKILFNYDGELKKYDGSIPFVESIVSECTSEVINNSIVHTNPVAVGLFDELDFPVVMDAENFENNFLICVDDSTLTNAVVNNLSKQFSNFRKTVVIDMLGIMNGEKFIAGKDFKLPLNTDSLDFIYKDCLDDATSDSKEMIKDLFANLSEYSKTVDFVPFDTLKTIVDDMVDKNHVFKLLVLKNKLAKLAQGGYLAKTKIEAENLKNILKNNFATIDLSRLNAVFQNRYISSIYSESEKFDEDVQIFIIASNTINKKNIKNVLTNKSIKSVFVTHSRFKYLEEIKSLFDNFIIEPSIVANNIFKEYQNLLGAMKKETVLTVGLGTNNLPLVLSTKAILNFPVAQKDKEILGEKTLEEIMNDVKDEDIATESGEIKTEVVDIKSSQENKEAVVLEETSSKIEEKNSEFAKKVAEETKNAVVPENLNIFDEDSEVEFKTKTHGDDVEQAPIEEVSEQIQVSDLENNDSKISDNEMVMDENIVEEPQAESEIIENDIEKAVKEPFINDFDAKNIDENASDKLREMFVEDEGEQSAVVDESLEPAFIDEEDDIIELPEEAENEEFIEVLNQDSEDVVALEPKEIVDDVEKSEIGINESFDNFDSIKPEIVEPQIIEEKSDDFMSDIIELDASETSDDDILIELENSNDENINPENVDKEIVQDVDKVFTTMKDDSISVDDLDFIDELNNKTALVENIDDNIIIDDSVEELEEYNGELLEISDSDNHLEENSFKEPEILETKNNPTPIVPVYNADIPPEDTVVSDNLEQGDTVSHATYGTGVVEKMTKYGTKTLVLINFDNVGRKFLDPALTELKKI